MTDSLKVGVLGMTHDHVWSNLHDLKNSSLGHLAAAADPHEVLRAQVQADIGCERVYADPAEMLDQEDLDAVYVFGDNRGGATLTCMALARGIPTMVEKPMASTLQEADAMLAASRTHDTLLMINWPFAWWPQLQHAFHMAEAGDIGRVFSTKYRSAHNGPRELGCSEFFCDWLYDSERNGAGALMDYCCYGAALARYMLGSPSRVTGITSRLVKDFVAQEDNAILVLSYPDAMAVTEASWSQIGHLTSYTGVFYGTAGTLVIHNTGRLQLANEEHDDGTDVEVPPSPAHLESATACFLSHLLHGTPILPLCDARVGRDAQEILEAGLMSGARGQAVSLPLPLQQ